MSQLTRRSCALLPRTLLLAALFVCTLPPMRAQEQPRHPDEPHAGDASNKPEPTPAVPPEKNSVTHHDLTLDGKALHYTATASTLIIRDGEDDHPYGSIFSVAYTLDGADPNTRPVTFLYNGGPGSATLWLHMGSVGPVRVVTASPKATGPAPYQVVPNQYRLLDKSDLVFVDAPPHRLLQSRRQRYRKRLPRRRSGHQSLRQIRDPLGHRQRPLELTQVPLR